MSKNRTTADNVAQRPPILQATTALGFSDAEVARALRVVPMVVSQWANGQRPIPMVRHLALSFIVEWENERLRQAADPDNAFDQARRLKVTYDACSHWLALSRLERGRESYDEGVAAFALLSTKDDVRDHLAELDAAARKLGLADQRDEGKVRDLSALLNKMLAGEEQRGTDEDDAA
jgi:hypothetical protein